MNGGCEASRGFDTRVSARGMLVGIRRNGEFFGDTANKRSGCCVIAHIQWRNSTSTDRARQLSSLSCWSIEGLEYHNHRDTEITGCYPAAECPLGPFLMAA